MLGPQQTHTDQYIDRSHDVTLGEQLSDSALDPPEHRIVLEVVDRNAHCRAVLHASRYHGVSGGPLRPPHDPYSNSIHSPVPKFVERILHAPTKLIRRCSKLVEALIKGRTLRGWQPLHGYLRPFEHVHEGGVIARVIHAAPGQQTKGLLAVEDRKFSDALRKP